MFTIDEIAFFSDQDINLILQEVDNETLQLALYDGPEFLKERIFKQFSYLGWKLFEMDRKVLPRPSKSQIKKAQEKLIEITESLMDSGALHEAIPTEN